MTLKTGLETSPWVYPKLYWQFNPETLIPIKCSLLWKALQLKRYSPNESLSKLGRNILKKLKVFKLLHNQFCLKVVTDRDLPPLHPWKRINWKHSQYRYSCFSKVCITPLRFYKRPTSVTCFHEPKEIWKGFSLFQK